MPEMTWLQVPLIEQRHSRDSGNKAIQNRELGIHPSVLLLALSQTSQSVGPTPTPTGSSDRFRFQVMNMLRAKECSRTDARKIGILCHIPDHASDVRRAYRLEMQRLLEAKAVIE